MSQEISDALEKLINDNATLRTALHAAEDIDGATRVLHEAACAANIALSAGQVNAFLSRLVSQNAELSEKDLDQVAAGAGYGLMDPDAAAWMFEAAATIHEPRPGQPPRPAVHLVPGGPPERSERAVGGVLGISG